MTSTIRSVPNTLIDEDSAPVSSPSATCTAMRQFNNHMASSSAWHLARSICTHACSMRVRPSSVGCTAAHSTMSSYSDMARPLHAASPTRSWLSWVVIMRQPSFSSPTRLATGTRTLS